MALTVSGLVIIGLTFIQQTYEPKPKSNPPPAPTVRETPGLKATQVSIEIPRNGRTRRFRATVMARKDETLTILTAAHCMSADDEKGPAFMTIDGEVVEGTVLSVVRNPAYQTNKSREIPGPDNAIAKLRFIKPTNKPAANAFESLKPAYALSARSYPGPFGQTIAVRMLDAQGVEHSVKAGNYNNPRWLEWGPGYKPIPGDSGGGVFVMHAGADGTPHPILIGIIVGVDNRGGGASLVSKEMRWIADELPR